MLVDLKSIYVKEGRGRKEFKGIPDLMESIKNHGLLHPPVVVEKDGKYELIAGERRYRAITLLGWEKLPVTLLEDVSELQKKELELEENIAREDLSWPEQIELYRQIDELKREIYGSKMQGDSKGDGWNTQKTAELVKVDRSNLQKQINFAKMLNDNPTLKETLKGLPLSTAMRKAKLIIEKEKVERVAKDKPIQADILLGDCRELIKEIPDESVNLLLTDIPYGIKAITDGEKDYQAIVNEKDNMEFKDTLSLMQDLIPELNRVLKPSSHFYIFFSINQYDFLYNEMNKKGFHVDPVPIVWDKRRTTTPFRGYSYSACYELCLFGHKLPRERMLSKPAKTIIEEKVTSIVDKVHVFQKPISLLRFFLEQSTNLGDVVLDPFAGSGSTIIAAKALGRTGIGFEVNKENYCNAVAYIKKAEEKQEELKDGFIENKE